MSLQTYLENLRNKPDHVKRRFSFWTSFGVTFIIFAFWISSLTGITGGSKSAVVATAVSNAGSPAQSLVASVGAFFVDIKDMVFGPKKIDYSSVEVSAGNR